MIKKVELHIDAIFAAAVVFAVSFGFNLYQRYQYSDLLQKYVDTEWERQNGAVSLKEAKAAMENCNRPQTGVSTGQKP
jgi:hypothetical protein